MRKYSTRHNQQTGKIWISLQLNDHYVFVGGKAAYSHSICLIEEQWQLKLTCLRHAKMRKNLTDDDLVNFNGGS